MEENWQQQYHQLSLLVWEYISTGVSLLQFINLILQLLAFQLLSCGIQFSKAIANELKFLVRIQMATKKRDHIITSQYFLNFFISWFVISLKKASSLRKYISRRFFISFRKYKFDAGYYLLENYLLLSSKC